MEDELDTGVHGDVAAALADIESGADGAGDYETDDQTGNGADTGDAPSAGEGQQDKTEIADEGTAEGSAGQAEGEATPDAAATAVEPPSDFTAEEVEAWRKLTPEAQQLLASYSGRSHASRTTVAKELDGYKKQYAPLEETAKQYDAYLKQSGVSVPQLAANYMHYHARLAFGDENVKRETLSKLAEQFGIPLGAPQQTDKQADPTNEYVDPEIKALKDEIAELKGLATKTSKTIEERDRMTEQQRLSEAQAQINAFRDEKDDKGNLKHPHFEKLGDRMERLLQAKEAKTLKEAYDKAALLDPEIQAEIQKAKADAKRADDAKKAAEAKKAAAANRKGDATPGKTAEALGYKDAALAAYDELAGAA